MLDMEPDSIRQLTRKKKDIGVKIAAKQVGDFNVTGRDLKKYDERINLSSIVFHIEFWDFAFLLSFIKE
ncbi:MAG: hypothetical protein NHB15_05495 [Methanosarcina barkeri]|nr:hypothetical protein [Methanosarcina sp. ERenArc_MAG2]